MSLRVEQAENREAYRVNARGELQLAVLVETKFREGFELSLSRPKVITRDVNGRLCEPVELAVIDIPEKFIGIVTEMVSSRRGRMNKMVNNGFGRVRLDFEISSRGLIGFRSQFLTETRGTGIMNTLLLGYRPHAGDIAARPNGVLVSDREGRAVTFAIHHLQPRGTIFVNPGDPVYTGMIVGENSRAEDIWVNITKEKKLTNIRAAGTDEALQTHSAAPVRVEQAMEYITDDELVEVTPASVRLRKMKNR